MNTTFAWKPNRSGSSRRVITGFYEISRKVYLSSATLSAATIGPHSFSIFHQVEVPTKETFPTMTFSTCAGKYTDAGSGRLERTDSFFVSRFCGFYFRSARVEIRNFFLIEKTHVAHAGFKAGAIRAINFPRIIIFLPKYVQVR